MRFTFSGTVGANTDETSKGYFDRSGTAKNGKPYESINFSVASNENNRGFVEIFGMQQDTVKTTDSDGNSIDFAWEDRLDKDIIDDVASYKKNVIQLGEDRHEYVTSYDAAREIKEHMTDMVGKKYVVTGNVSKNFYNGKATDRFQITNIYPFSDKSKDRLIMKGELFFTKDSVDLDDWAEEKKITVSAYSMEYIPEEKKRMYYPRTFIFDCSKVDFTNEKHVLATKLKLRYLGCELNGEKVKCVLKPNKVYKVNATLSYVNGNEEIPFDESELTDLQREAVELGLKTVNDFRPAGSSIYGKRVTYLKFIDMDMRDDYSEGCAMLDDTLDEFEDEIYAIPSADSELLTVRSEANAETDSSASNDTDDDDDDLDLFS